MDRCSAAPTHSRQVFFVVNGSFLFSIVLECEAKMMQAPVFITHCSDRPPPLKQPFERRADVCRPVSITIQRELAGLCLAQPQPSNLSSSYPLDTLPSATWPEASTARLACVCLGGRGHYKMFGQLAHYSDADRGWISLVAWQIVATSHEAPRSVREDQRTCIGFETLNPRIESALALLRLEC